MLNIIRTPLLWGERNEPDYMHPSVAPLPDGRYIMTLQQVLGDDHYGAPEFSVSDDGGRSWSGPRAIPGLETVARDDGLSEGFADMRCFSLSGGIVLAIGCNSYYTPAGNICWERDARHCRSLPEYPVYTVFQHGQWSDRQILDGSKFFGHSWRIACAQIVELPDHTLLLPVYFDRNDRFSACTIHARWRHNRTLEIIARGNLLEYPFERGFIEPSIIQNAGRFHMTIRAEDNRGYHCTSRDGLHWDEPRCWRWDDQMPLMMSSTQQHWFNGAGKLYLLYTRKTAYNENVMRWRAPLFIAEFDISGDCLIRHSEQEVFPYRSRDGMNNRLGNFHVAQISDTEGLVSDSNLFLQMRDDKIIDRVSEVISAKIKVKR